MITIIFESHATTLDNRDGLAAGWYDVALSDTGQEQARQMGERYRGQQLDAIFCSDLQRSYKTAQLAFGNQYPIHQDQRLRECNYGTLNRAPKAAVEAMREHCLRVPFPEGESYQDTTTRMRAFLQDIQQNYDSKTVLIVGHRATQYGLERWLNHKSLHDAVLAPWQWQPGWRYQLTTLPKE